MKVLKRRVTTAYDIWRAKGWQGVKRRVRRIVRRRREECDYRKWVEKHTINDHVRADILENINTFDPKPLISIIMPVYNIEEKWLRLCIDSVLKQLYTNWELCIADDHSTMPHIRRVLEEYTAKDGRIRVVFRETNGHISAASNSALEMANGEFTVLLDHDDELAEDALYWVIKEINDFGNVSMIYSDEDKIDENGRRFYPSFKPDWSRDLFYSLNLVTHLSAYRTDVIRQIGGFRTGFEGSQDYDLALRVIEQIPEEQIRHIPRILYHWRAIKGSVALGGSEKTYAHERAREAIRSHFARTGTKATVSATHQNLHRVAYGLPDQLPKVAIIIDVDLDREFTEKAVRRFGRGTAYGNFEIVVVSGETDHTKFENGTVMFSDLPSRAGRLNQAALRTQADLYCFVDIDLLPKHPDWLEEMVRFAIQPEIGVVGANILNIDDSLISGGSLIGVGGIIANAHESFDLETLGNMRRNIVTGNFSAVSGSCMIVRSELFMAINGFDAETFPARLFDADLCLRTRGQGLRIVLTPYAAVVKTDPERSLRSQIPVPPSEAEAFSGRWKIYIDRDPFYNPNLSKKDGSFSIDI